MHCIGELIDPTARCFRERYGASTECRADATAAIILSEPIAMMRSHSRSGTACAPSAPLAYATGQLGEQTLPFRAADRVVAIGSDRMMAAVAAARHGVLAPHLEPHHFAIGSINSPMQCMMKEICAQCLQPHRDPVTGQRSYVFSCFNQDQPLDSVDVPRLATRLSQNSVQEKLTAQWIDRCLIHLQRRAAAA